MDTMDTDERDEINAKTDEKAPDRQDRFDHDGFWKDLIERFFYGLLKRAVPELYEAADLSVKPKFLEQEFRDILNTGDPTIRTSPHYADTVAEVSLKEGGVRQIICHAEAQTGSGGGNLAERMFNYQCLIYAHYRRNPVALAIIVGARRENERSYTHSHYGTEVVYRYNNLVLSELDDEELKSSDNPIDLALYAAKHASQVKEEHQKYNFLRTLTELLGERGWDRHEKRDLALFLARIVNLKDKALQEKYWEYRQELDKGGKLMYESFLKEVEERMAERRGVARGVAEGKEEMARSLLANGVSPDIIARSAGLPLEKIHSLMH